jgi:glycine/D-amino acid oxidase-like deaminating enzyme
VELKGGRAGHVVLGGGVLGLSAAWRLAERGADVLVLEKGLIGGGASGAAGGIVRNYYRSPAITEIIKSSVDLFEAEAEEFGFHQVGYAAAVPPGQVDDLVAIREQHERAGYESELIVGPDECRTYLEFSWPDFTAPVAALLHERRGGWADPMQTIRHLARRARDAGATIAEEVEVTGFEVRDGGVEAVRTSHGSVACETLVLAPGPWVEPVWRLLGLEPEVAGRPLVSYLKAQEGEFQLPGVGLAGRAGAEPPVLHLDQTGELRSDRDDRLIHPGPWGIYLRMGRTGTGVTGGGLPEELADPLLDPYGPGNPEHAAGAEFEEFFVSGLAAAFGRFRGRAEDWRSTLGGGIVAHTPDNYPICDWVLDNAYAIVDSGHGFKMLALGRLAADDVLDRGDHLAAFGLGRFERGETHVASKGPYPWT